jgi:molybdate transport system permease protein
MTDQLRTTSSRRPRSDRAFYIVLGVICGAYVVLLLAMLAADVGYVFAPSHAADNPAGFSWRNNPLVAALADPNIRHAIHLTLVSCTITTLLSLWVAVPVGYLFSRHEFFGKRFLDAVLDIPIVLPPLVVGISLLILFQYLPIAVRDAVVYQVPAVILAQFVVACAFAVRTMRATFDQIDGRREQVALTLGCSRLQAFGWVVLPETTPGMLTAATLAWARSLGEFGPLLVFAGATRGKTEVLSTTVYLELSVGNLRGAVAVSLLMIAAAVTALVIARQWGVASRPEA